MSIVDRNRGAKRAREARAALGLDPAAPVPCLLTCVEERFPVVVAPLVAEVAGACTSGPLLWVNGRHAAVRQRFTLAHELGHAWCKHDAHAVVDTVETLSGKPTNTHEMQANAFASEFLLPKVAMVDLARWDAEPTLDHVVLIGATYGTSAIAVLFRLSQLKLAGEARVEELRAAIDAGEHFAAYERLGCTPMADGLGTMEELPYLSEPLRGGRLGAVLRGDAEAEPELATAISRLLG